MFRQYGRKMTLRIFFEIHMMIVFSCGIIILCIFRCMGMI